MEKMGAHVALGWHSVSAKMWLMVHFGLGESMVVVWW